MSVYAAFERESYRGVVEDVRKHKPEVRLRDAWVYNHGRDHWSFYYQDYYWQGSASGAFDARAKGWAAWLRKQEGN